MVHRVSTSLFVLWQKNSIDIIYWRTICFHYWNVATIWVVDSKLKISFFSYISVSYICKPALCISPIDLGMDILPKAENQNRNPLKILNPNRNLQVISWIQNFLYPENSEQKNPIWINLDPRNLDSNRPKNQFILDLKHKYPRVWLHVLYFLYLNFWFNCNVFCLQSLILFCNGIK